MATPLQWLVASAMIEETGCISAQAAAEMLRDERTRERWLEAAKAVIQAHTGCRSIDVLPTAAKRLASIMFPNTELDDIHPNTRRLCVEAAKAGLLEIANCRIIEDLLS